MNVSSYLKYQQVSFSQLIVLAAGKSRYNYFPLKRDTSNTMLPINGKPVIWWILNLIKSQAEFKKVIVVIDYKDDFTRSYLKEMGLQITVAEVSDSKSILESLSKGLAFCEKEWSTGIILGDTLFQDKLDTCEDLVYVHPVKQKSRWCMAVSDGKGFLYSLYDKPSKSISSDLALCGYYHFTNTKSFVSSCSDSLRNKETELSACIMDYHQKHPVRMVRNDQWFDFGNPDHMVGSKHRLLQSRSFNSVSVDSIKNTITKKSTKIEKLQDELNWFLSIPKDITILTPRLVDYGLLDHEFFIEQEFYGYYTLAELFLFADLDESYWETILFRIIGSYSLFREYIKPADKESLKDIYWDKTFVRVKETEQLSEAWYYKLNTLESVVINEKKHHSFKFLEPWIKQKIQLLIDGSLYFHVIHGDLCFSNILFDLNGHMAKFIDPRGRFGKEKIYGDSRYDMAKLRHSIHGKYDFIVNDLFDLVEHPDLEFSFNFVHQQDHLEGIAEVLDHILKLQDYNIQEIEFIEALLFLSMIPLHKDNNQRQLAMYLTAVKIFNTLYLNENSN